jgi:hypothetical protein
VEEDEESTVEEPETGEVFADPLLVLNALMLPLPFDITQEVEEDSPMLMAPKTGDEARSEDKKDHRG